MCPMNNMNKTVMMKLFWRTEPNGTEQMCVFLVRSEVSSWSLVETLENSDRTIVKKSFI